MRLELNASCLPSGESVGEMSTAELRVSRRMQHRRATSYSWNSLALPYSIAKTRRSPLGVYVGVALTAPVGARTTTCLVPVSRSRSTICHAPSTSSAYASRLPSGAHAGETRTGALATRSEERRVGKEGEWQ